MSFHPQLQNDCFRELKERLGRSRECDRRAGALFFPWEWDLSFRMLATVFQDGDGLPEGRELTLSMLTLCQAHGLSSIISWNSHYISESKEQDSHFVAEETEVQRWEVVCIPHSHQAQGPVQLTWERRLQPYLTTSFLLFVLSETYYLHSSSRWKLVGMQQNSTWK